MFSLALAVFLIPFAAAIPNLDCTYDPTGICPGATKIIGLSDITNAHAELPSIAIYEPGICCSDQGPASLNIIAESITGQTILNLNDQTNAHTAFPGQGYDDNIQLNLSAINENGGTFFCQENSTCVQTQEECVIKLSDNETNAHVEDCSQPNYESSLCCRLLYNDGTTCNDHEQCIGICVGTFCCGADGTDISSGEDLVCPGESPLDWTDGDETCSCANTEVGNICDDHYQGVWEGIGICAYNESDSVYICANNTVAINCPNGNCDCLEITNENGVFTACSASTTMFACENEVDNGTVADDGFQQDGVCLTNNLCDTINESVFDSGIITESCTLSNPKGGFICDFDAGTGGNFMHNGYCTDDGNCDLDNLTAMNCSMDGNPVCDIGLDNVTPECSPSIACDNTTADWLPWTQDGTCLTNGACDETGEVVLDQNLFKADCSEFPLGGQVCDDEAFSGGNFDHNGYCTTSLNCDSDGITAMDCMTDADPLCEMGFDNVIDECNPGLACDNIPDDWLPWMQDGTCLTDSSCDTVGIVAINYASGFYEDNCTLAVSGSMCDSSVLNGNFLHNGYCLDNDNCDIDDEVVMDCDSNGNNICEIGIDPVYDECINHAGDACDSNTTDSSEWRQNGTCTSTSCDTEGEIAFQESTGSFLDDCATAGSGYICDSNILEGDFDDSGYCLSNDDCSTQQLTSMYCNATGTFDCELVIDTVVDGCTPGRACDMTPGTGTPWNQDGTCLSDLSCDDDTEVAFNGSDYFSDCLDLGVGALCDNYAVSGGDFNPIGQCTIPNPSLGLCDIELPVVTRIEVNTSDYGWGNEITELLCFNATDDSGILHNNYSFQYTTDDSGSNGWTDISGCTATTEQCIWNTSDIIFDRTTWVRCRAMDLAEQYSNFTNTSFNGIDTILPAVTLIEPQNNYIWDHSLTVNFTYFIDENLNLTNCSLLINDSVVKTVDNMTNGTINQFRYALVKGDYTWNVHCHDIADNTGKGDKRNITSIIYEAIFVNNMGVVGFDMTNPEYTYSEAVWLELYFHTTNTGCRYMNQGGAWTYWQQCESMKFWSLTPGEGLKTVFYQINHSDHEFTLLNDSITLIYSGAGLDTTPPSAPEVTDDGNFTNDNSTLHAVWTRSYDHESEILGIPIYYEYKVDNTIYDSWTRTSEIEITLENLTLNEGRNYVFDVRAVNSANLTNESQSDGITVDITAPDITSVWSTTHPNPGMWYPERDVILSWNGSDAIAGISGFSFVLDDHNDTTPGDLSIDLTTKIYQDLADSIYYFHIKAADAADNFGDTSHFRIAIDTSRPTKPEFINITFNSSSNEVFFQWTESVDEESGIMQYELNITEGGSSTIYTTTDTTITVSVNSGNEYYAKVRSRNWANQTSVYSDEEERIDTTPPTIISQLPTNGADVSTDEARLILRTDEKAICRYDNSTDFVDFIFTNSLHHETKMGLEPGSYSYSIRCTDMFGNSATNQMSFSTTEQLAGSIEIISTDARFSRKIATADVEVQNSLEGITKERWGVRIGDQPIDFSAADMGSGNYRITFETPDKPGTFTLTVISDSGSDSAEIEITKPLLNIEFTGSELKPIDLNRVVYLKEEDYAVGIATESRIANIGSNDDSISISSDNKDQSYIFMTKRSANIANKEDYLKQMEFIELINPSFGYLITDEYTIIDKLSYDNIEIKGSVNLFPGYYNLEITNKGYDLEGKKIVEIRITEEDKKQEIIIQHE